MKYYVLSHSAEKNEVGDWPQADSTEVNHISENDPKSRANLSNEHFPEVGPSLDLKLSKKAKFTDIVSTSNITARGIFVSEEVKKSLEKFKIMNHKFYPGSVLVKEERKIFYWLHIVNDSLKGIDFEKSKFAEYDICGDVERSGIIWRSEKELYSMSLECDGLNYIGAGEIVLKEEYRKFDIFLFPNIHRDIIISEAVLNDLKANGFSGYRIREADFMS